MKTTRKDQQGKKTETYKGILELLLVIGIILLIPLFFAVRTAANSQPAPLTPTTSAPITASASEESAAVKPQQPPACTFPLAEIKVEESKPEEYVFSEPQVVLTAPKGNLYGIVEWLPDSQQVLITENLRNNFVENNNNSPQQSISLYNPDTGEIKVYAIRPETQEPPSWHSGLNAVVYPAMNYFDVDKKNRTYKLSRQIWVSYGDPDAAQLLDDNLPQTPLAVKPDGSEMFYLSDKKISKLDKSLKELPSISFDPAQWDYAKERRYPDSSVSYKMAWQPGTSLVFLYSEANGKGGYTFILNAETGQVCELNFGGWVEEARWSPDGRYLAAIRSKKYVYPTYSAELTLLDTVTGTLVTPDVISQEIAGQHYIQGFTWAPDSRHLLAIGNLILSQNSLDENDNQWLLYLVDGISGQSINVEADYKNFTASPNNSLAWSPDGSKLVVHCQAPQYIDQICLISIQSIGQ